MKYGETRGLLWMKNSQNKRICKVMALAALGVAQAVCISAAGTEQLPTLQEMTQRKPDAGMLQNEWRDRQRLAASQITNGSASVQIPEGQKSALNMDTTTKVRVNEFKITGQDVVEDQKLQELLADKKGKDLTFADLQQGADTLTQYFRSHGYLIAKTYLPVQDVTDGVVTYDVVIGRIDDVTIQTRRPMARARSVWNTTVSSSASSLSTRQPNKSLKPATN